MAIVSTFWERFALLIHLKKIVFILRCWIALLSFFIFIMSTSLLLACIFKELKQVYNRLNSLVLPISIWAFWWKVSTFCICLKNVLSLRVLTDSARSYKPSLVLTYDYHLLKNRLAVICFMALVRNASWICWFILKSLNVFNIAKHFSFSLVLASSATALIKICFCLISGMA